MNENYMELLALQNQKKEVQAVVSINKITSKFGLQLSEQEAQYLVECKTKCLKEVGRLEFGEGVLRQILFAFCDSPYLYQDNYLEMLEGLQSIFYLYKNESLDEVTDEELIEAMYHIFHEKAKGSLEYLEETGLEVFARKIRRNSQGFLGASRENQEEEDDDEDCDEWN